MLKGSEGGNHISNQLWSGPQQMSRTDFYLEFVVYS